MNKEQFIESKNFNTDETKRIISKFNWTPLSTKIHENEICPTDRGSHYLYAGQSALYSIKLAIDSSRRDPGEFKKVLDYPCGHGRVLRWLHNIFPESSIYAGDTDDEAMNFCCNTFDALQFNVDLVKGFDSEYSDFFDLVWVGSLFTHLSKSDCTKLFENIMQILSPRGLIVGTFAGDYSKQFFEHKIAVSGLSDDKLTLLSKDYQSYGFAFSHYDATPESNYGLSLGSLRFLSYLNESHEDVDLIYFSERGWDYLQDVAAFQKINYL